MFLGTFGVDETRRAPSKYVPEKREIGDLYEEDKAHEDEYKTVMDMDEDVVVTGVEGATTKLE